MKLPEFGFLYAGPAEEQHLEPASAVLTFLK